MPVQKRRVKACLEATLFTSSSLSVLLFSTSDDEDCLYDRVSSTPDKLISSSFPLRPMAALSQDQRSFFR
jgi:hypothetical protein